MTEQTEFKVPSTDLKVLTKSRKSGLPASVTKVNIPLPSPEDLSNAEQFSQNAVEIPPVPYKEPTWSGKCDSTREYSFEVEKNGVIIQEVKQLQSKSFWLFGRLPNCDFNLAHPTISRYHAILQYRAPTDPIMDSEEPSRSKHVTAEGGWYLYDMNSTHGTFLNKQKLPARTYFRVRVGYMIKLGSSSRTYIFQGPSDDEDEPTQLTITEIKENAKKQRALQQEISEIERKEKERIEKLKEEEGINWGMGEDADEETDLTENPYAASNNEELFLDDPKKTLRGYFEREGHDLDYKVDELSSGTYCCKVELPIDDANGRPIVAEATLKGKKKEVVVQCALEACRILDRHGLLRQANHEPRRRFQKQSDSDDDDEYLDRTGAVEKRRERKLSSQVTQTHTYPDLIQKEANILDRLEQLESKIQNSRLIKHETHMPENEYDVDEFLKNMPNNSFDKFELRRLRLEQVQLNEELKNVKKLIEITKPVDLDEILSKKVSADPKRHMFPLYGKRNKLTNTFGIRESNIKAEKDVETESTNVVKQSETKNVTKSSPTAQSKSELNAYLDDHSPRQPRDDEACSTSGKKRKSLDGNMCSSNTAIPSVTDSSGSGGSKKKRPGQRPRNVGVRKNVDFDDNAELESEDRNVEWVPPSGQTGDGRTSLNEKYGY